jgi:hypothetical protein
MLRGFEMSQRGAQAFGRTRLFHSFVTGVAPGRGLAPDTWPVRGPSTCQPVFTPHTWTVISQVAMKVINFLLVIVHI